VSVGILQKFNPMPKKKRVGMYFDDLPIGRMTDEPTPFDDLPIDSMPSTIPISSPRNPREFEQWGTEPPPPQGLPIGPRLNEQRQFTNPELAARDTPSFQVAQPDQTFMPTDDRTPALIQQEAQQAEADRVRQEKEARMRKAQFPTAVSMLPDYTGYGQTSKETADVARSMLPYFGGAEDIKNIVEDPSLLNWIIGAAGQLGPIGKGVGMGLGPALGMLGPVHRLAQKGFRDAFGSPILGRGDLGTSSAFRSTPASEFAKEELDQGRKVLMEAGLKGLLSLFQNASTSHTISKVFPASTRNTHATEINGLRLTPIIQINSADS
jgi:hypothetical protein